MAGAALAAAGQRDIHMISLRGNEYPVSVYRQREIGYLEAMAESGRTPRILRAREGAAEAEADQTRILTGERLPDAIFCWSDIHAVPLVNLALSSGVEVPDRLAIIGYDNTPVAALPLIGLSSIDQDPTRIGELAAEKLLSRIEGREVAEHVLVEPRLVRRMSF
jgi:LacI family transcriptional regulator